MIRKLIFQTIISIMSLILTKDLNTAFMYQTKQIGIFIQLSWKIQMDIWLVLQVGYYYIYFVNRWSCSVM